MLSAGWNIDFLHGRFSNLRPVFVHINVDAFSFRISAGNVVLIDHVS